MEGFSDTIIFFQAPNDLRYILDFYEKNKQSSKISILVIGSDNNFKFLKTLNLNANIIQLPSFEIKSIHLSIFQIVNCKKILKQFNKLKLKIYYFSNNHDLTTAFCLKKLSSDKNLIIKIDLYKYSLQKYNSNILEKLSLILINKSLGINLKFYNSTGLRLYVFELSPDHIIEPFDINVSSKYKVNVNVKNEKSILLLESNGITQQYFKNYTIHLTKIIELLLKNKYQIFVKPHPRLGYQDILNNYKNIIILDSFIPSEFFELGNFDFIFGIESTAIANFSIDNSNAYSLLKLFKYSNLEYKKELEIFLNDISKNKLQYLETEKQFNDVIKNI